MKLKRIIKILAAFALALLLIVMVSKAHVVAVTHYTVAVSDLPEPFNGFRILHISDLHSKNYGRKQEGLVALLDDLQYDLVVVTGDMVDTRNKSLAPAIRLLELLEDKPVYFVPGNHEKRTGVEFREKLDDMNVIRLENRSVQFGQTGQHLWLVGVNDPHENRDRLQEALFDVTDDAPRILLAHTPTIFEEAVEEQIDLVLVGHTHGGQIRLPFLGVLVIAGQGLFPKYVYGEYKKGSTTMLVNSGIGETVLNLRLNTQAEVVIITLRAQ